MTIDTKVTQLVSAEALIGQAVDLIVDAARICREAGEGDTPRKLYRAADTASSVIDAIRSTRTSAEACASRDVHP
jgi:hypothetical protein